MRPRRLYIPVFGLATILTILVLANWASDEMKVSTSILPIVELFLVWGCVFLLVRRKR